MKPPRRLSAFTLVELLVVLVIVAIMLSLSTGFTRRTQNTFVSQQFIKTILLNTRILRRKSMLISRNSGDSSWVNGIGFKISKDANGNWEFTQQKVLAPGATSYYYRAYPLEKDVSASYFQQIPDSPVQKLSQGLSIKVIPSAIAIPAEKTCLTYLDSLYVVFESINGKMHAYCNTLNAPIMPLGAVDASGVFQPSVTISIMYNSTQGYMDKVTLLSNGEISTTR